MKNYQWIHPPLKLTRDQFQEVYDSAYVEIDQDDVPEDDKYRYTDREGRFHEQEDYQEYIYGYFLIAGDQTEVDDPIAASTCVEVKGATFFSIGGHTDSNARHNLGNVAGRGELYLISLADYHKLAAGTPSTYLLDRLVTDRSAEDPYLWAKERF